MSLSSEIETLRFILIAMQEGASDEKRMAMDSMERLIEKKQEQLKSEVRSAAHM